MAESQIRPLFKSHPDIYQRFLNQFDYTIDHLNDPIRLEEHYSLHYIELRKFSGGLNMGHEEAHKEAYKRTSDQYWKWRNRGISKGYMQLMLTRHDEAITARSEPTSDYEIESDDGMDIDDEDVALSPVDEMFGLEVYGEPQGWLQKSRKRLFDDDDDDEANHDVTNKRGKFTHW
ncbi:uncharacterized protein FSUBG_10439 [Fusarium subglutinans]|uniref:Uncharacterized protein n=1 Tax=Gibberella subglutinans TaxID=42677 RepID=A0A8H5UKS5_GIBSU|nr:uncharacterized protein FSUBG_10439 [Fusarium subglutinans]KAF5591513.1 hypothetical protein FSUBG_10439 [Fusarium subglutinans]